MAKERPPVFDRLRRGLEEGAQHARGERELVTTRVEVASEKSDRADRASHGGDKPDK